MRPLLYLPLSLLVSLPASADSMRCGKWVVNEQSAPDEIVQKCGEPQDKRATTEDVLGKNALGNPIKLGVSTKETWYYRPSTRSLPMVVKIVDGRVTALERADE
jgi:hypothetical protein